MCCVQANLAMKINVKVGGVNTCWSVLGQELLRGYFNKEVCCAVLCCAVVLLCAVFANECDVLYCAVLYSCPLRYAILVLC
jgi:hypothetical protein